MIRQIKKMFMAGADVAGSSKACVVLTDTAVTTLTNGAYTLVNLANVSVNRGNGYLEAITNGIKIIQAGLYRITVCAGQNANNTAFYFHVNIFKNGAQIRNAPFYAGRIYTDYIVGGGAFVSALNAGDEIKLYCWLSSSEGTTLNGFSYLMVEQA